MKDKEFKQLLGREILKRWLAEREKAELLAELPIDFLEMYEAKVACKASKNDVDTLKKQLEAANQAKNETPPTMKEFEELKAELEEVRDIALKARAETKELLRVHNGHGIVLACMRENQFE